MNKHMLTSLLLAVGLLGSVSACSSNDFAGSGKRAAKDPSTATPGLGDEDGNANDQADADTNGNPTIDTDKGDASALRAPCEGVQAFNVVGKNDTVKVQGEVCPKSFGKMNLLFVVDHSGSMREADPSILPGLNLAACGRSRAAQRIVDRIKQDLKQGDEVTVSLVVFGERAQIALRGIDIGTFRAEPRQFCRDDLGTTNYSEAFVSARQALQGDQQGNSVVYFISDGLPTSGGSGPDDNEDLDGLHAQAGLQSAQQLRTAVPNLTLNAIFLETPDLTRDPQGYLSSLAGGADKVRVADAADQLADRIVELAIPRVSLVTGGVQAKLTAAGFGDKAVRIASFNRANGREGVWLFETESFQLFKRPDQTVENVFKLEVRDSGGTPFTSEIRMNFKSR